MNAINEFLTTKTGGKLHTKITTGRTYYTEVYERAYTATILAVNAGIAHIALASHDNAPSGYGLAGTELNHGEGRVRVDDCATLAEFWRRLLDIADPEFARYATVR